MRHLAEGRNVAWKLTLHGWTVRCCRISWSPSEYRHPIWQVFILEVHGFPKNEHLADVLAAVSRRHGVEYRLAKTSVTSVI